MSTISRALISTGKSIERAAVRVENGKIVEIGENELFSLYLERGVDDLMSFPDYVEKFKAAGCVVHEK